VVFVVPGIAGLVLEPALFVLADRYPRRWFVRCGLAAMAVGAAAAALAPGPITLACALAVWYVAGGLAVALTEATLVDLWPERRAATIARWALISLAGDIAAPALLGVLAGNWRTGFAIAAGVLAAWAVAVSVRAFPQPPPAPPAEPDEPQPSLLAVLRDALTDRTLVLWLFGVALCDLLDEILVVFASLHLRRDLGAGTTTQSITIGAFVAGSALGLLALDRLLKHRAERTLLVATGLACAACYVAWLCASTVWLAAVLAVPVGATSAPLYPLAAAQAYARRPGRSGSVLAASHLFTPLGLALPWLIGAVADRAGLVVALALLVAQPLGLVALVIGERSRTSARSPNRD
jgi:MFS family permease